jgi:hypothetical protein
MTTARSSRASKRALTALLAVIATAGGTRVSAHRLDELSQAARIAIEPGRVELEMSLTPGTAVAGDLIREIDADGNGAFSQAEKQAYAGRALSALMVRVDEGPRLRLVMAEASVPDAAAMRTGDAVIVLRAVAVPSTLSAGSHRLFFRNEHAPANSVYLANALVPESDQVAVTGQQRDGDQRALTIDFAIAEATASSISPWVWAGIAGAFLTSMLLRRRVHADERAPAHQA